MHSAPTEGWILAGATSFITKRIARTRITPNAVTVCAFIAAATGGVVIGQGGYWAGEPLLLERGEVEPRGRRREVGVPGVGGDGLLLHHHPVDPVLLDRQDLRLR